MVSAGSRYQERVPMSRLRQRIAERLLDAQQQAAILTTFNEVDMHAVMSLRSKYKDLFKDTQYKTRFYVFFCKSFHCSFKVSEEMLPLMEVI